MNENEIKDLLYKLTSEDCGKPVEEVEVEDVHYFLVDSIVKGSTPSDSDEHRWYWMHRQTAKVNDIFLSFWQYSMKSEECDVCDQVTSFGDLWIKEVKAVQKTVTVYEPTEVKDDKEES